MSSSWNTFDAFEVQNLEISAKSACLCPWFSFATSPSSHSNDTCDAASLVTHVRMPCAPWDTHARSCAQ